jgi:DNA-directed RNA polymerase subunit RPC12/RpoP
MKRKRHICADCGKSFVSSGNGKAVCFVCEVRLLAQLREPELKTLEFMPELRNMEDQVRQMVNELENESGDT